MPTAKSNLTQVPVNSDTFNLTGDLGTMGESIMSMVPVASDSAGDTVATTRAAAGFAVSDSRPLFAYNTATKTPRVKDSTGWRNMSDSISRSFAHVGRTANFQTITSGAVIVMPTPQVIAGGMTWDSANNAVVVPLAGWYRVSAQYYFTGASGGMGTGYIVKNNVLTAPVGARCSMSKPDSSDYIGFGSAIVQLAANDKVQLWMQWSSSTWGTTGWDGSYFEVEWYAPLGQF